ncbi:MAG: type III-A CRISPR-associated protein Cas10/Csm1 [Thermodesulfobacteriota bacterium]
MEKERNGLVLGSLFHDIGKIKQRAGYEEDRGKAHVQIGHEWLVSQYGEGLIASGARNHHGNEPETWESNMALLFYEADNCAASERRGSFDPEKDTGKEWQREISLANVFSRVRNPHPRGNAEHASQSYVALGRADRWAPPTGEERKNSVQGYRLIWEGFEREFSVLRGLNNHHNVDAICHLLEKYASTVPSITLKVYSPDEAAEYAKHPDVSLFDHLKLTAAAALCMYHYFRETQGERWQREVLKEEITGDASRGEDSKPFLLVGGDVSGIQRFIYTISSKGALRSLKGRSFYLELLVEHTVDRLLAKLGLSRCNVIFTGGGHFYLMAPNTLGVLEGVKSVRSSINGFLFDHFNGAVEQFIESVAFGKPAFKDCTELWESLSGRLEAGKRHRWEDRLSMILSGPLVPDRSCLEQSCSVCGREDQALTSLSVHEPEVMVCEPCKEQYVLGGLLQKSTGGGEKAIVCRLAERPRQGEAIRIGDSFYTLFSGKGANIGAEIPASASAVFHLNDWDMGSFAHPLSRPLFAGVYLPDAPSCKDLEGMAEGGLGMARLGVLRMDMDNLGRVFSSSMGQGERTLSRTGSLSRQLSLFFKYHLDRILGGHDGYPATLRIPDREGERRSSVIYSGGDDLFVIGHWLDVTEAAFDIRKSFNQFTANEYITLSAGVAIGGIHEPVYRLAELSGRAEKKAKDSGKNAVTFFDAHTFSWKAAEPIIQRLRDLNAMTVKRGGRLELPEGSISRGGLYNLLNLSREHRRIGAWILPKLAWFFGRFRPAERFSGPWNGIKNFIFSNEVDWHCLEVAVLWNIMTIRKEGDR